MRTEGDRAITVRDLSNGKMLMPEPPGVQVRRHLFSKETTMLACNMERSVDIFEIPFVWDDCSMNSDRIAQCRLAPRPGADWRHRGSLAPFVAVSAFISGNRHKRRNSLAPLPLAPIKCYGRWVD